MDPSARIGLAVLPPAASMADRCAQAAGPRELQLTASAPYVVVPLSTDFCRTAQLNSASDLVSTMNCVVGNGGTAYATALEAAQAELDAHGAADVQDVIVFLSDGAANYGPTYYGDTRRTVGAVPPGGLRPPPRSRRGARLIYSIGYDLDALDGGANTCQDYLGPLESRRSPRTRAERRSRPAPTRSTTSRAPAS